MNKLTINVGPMFSGKTTALQQQGKKHFKAGQKVVFLKPSIDTRYSINEIVSHDGDRVEAINITNSILINEALEAEIILIDEVQFFSANIVSEIWELIKKGKTIYCSGLDTNYLGEGFETTMKLMAIADEINKYTSVCKCGNEATMSSKKTDNGVEVELGADEIYYPTCKKCFMK